MTLRQTGFLIGVLSAALGGNNSKLKTVPFVDLNRYAGKWYEIARYPNRFEKKCARDITAEYTLISNSKVRVVNSCVTANGKRKVTAGSAKVMDRSNAKLKVTFFWPFYGDYWVIDLDPDYQYAVVSEPRKKYLWILSRTPQMDAGTYDQIAARLRVKGFDSTKLIRPMQSGPYGSTETIRRDRSRALQLHG